MAWLQRPAFQREIFNRAGEAGPRRLLVIGGVFVGILVAIVAAIVIRFENPAGSRVAKMPPVSQLPGGLRSNREQEALRVEAGQGAAQKAAAAGQSYTPPMAGSEKLHAADVIEGAEPAAPEAPAVSKTASAGPITVTPRRSRTTPADYPQTQAGTAKPIPLPAATRKAADDLFASFAGRPPQTELILPAGAGASGTEAAGAPARSETSAKPIQPASVLTDPPKQGPSVLVAAGHGIYAHTVLSVDSDTGGPLVLQADSGPLRGDRMIATFSKNGNDRLVVRINSVEHGGKSLPADAIVVAPETLETAVATSVDEHYLNRFILPAAAAFVSGLGQAIATTSNSTAVVSPFGGTTSTTHLAIGQQLGVAAGTAATSVSGALAQEGPKAPTVHLGANANVGVMFLANLDGIEKP